jgi:RNA polymerase sigma-70 factor (ECF subfamily)
MEKPGKGGRNAEGVYRWYSGYVRRVLRYFGVADSDLPDTSQEVFIVVHRKLDDFQGRSDIRTWLYRICANAASDYRRRAYRRRERSTEAPPELISRDDPHTRAVFNEQASSLLEALHDLNEAQRRVFIMYEIQQRSASDIADVEGCPLKTVFSRLYAARRHLLERLRADDSRLPLGLVLAPGRWLETPGIERVLLPLQPSSATAAKAGWLFGMLGKPSLAAIGLAAVAACLISLGGTARDTRAPGARNQGAPLPSRVSQTDSDRPAKRKVTSDTSIADRSVLPEPAPGAVLSFASAETSLARADRRNRRPSSAEQEPTSTSVTSSPSVEPVSDREEVDLVVYRTGRLDRMLSPLDSPSGERPRTIANPVDRDYPELADLTAQEL